MYITMGKSHRWAANEERKAGVSEVGTLSGLNTWGNFISTEPTWLRHVTSVRSVKRGFDAVLQVLRAVRGADIHDTSVAWNTLGNLISTEPTWIRHVTSVRSVTCGFALRDYKCFVLYVGLTSMIPVLRGTREATLLARNPRGYGTWHYQWGV